VTGEEASADTVAANNFIPELTKMVEEESFSPKQVLTRPDFLEAYARQDKHCPSRKDCSRF
jgi:hypothetical protein